MPDGTGIRNYLYSRLLSEFPEGTEILLWHNISEKAIEEVRKLHTHVKITEEKIPVYVENFKERVLREASAYARLCWNARQVENETILSGWKKSGNNFKRKIVYTVAETIGSWARKDYKKIRRIEKKYTSLITRASVLEPYTMLLEKYKPDVVFCTHQRVSWLVPAIEAAKKLNIKTVTAIYSWDNLPKARLPLRPNSYIVWSAYMKMELHKFYPEIPLQAIEITGTPQFEFYSDESRIWSREDFCARFNLDSTKKFICYSGDDEVTSPYDPSYLNDLAEAVAGMDEAIRPQIIFRRCPVDFSNRFDSVLATYKTIITSINPLWQTDNNNEWTQYYPMPGDIDLLVNLAHHCELAVNIGSTIAHDFATVSKPTCYINYDQVFAKGWSVKVLYRYEHFRSMAGLSPVIWIRSKKEIRNIIFYLLTEPKIIEKDSVEWLERIASKNYQQAGKRIAKYLLTDVIENVSSKANLLPMSKF